MFKNYECECESKIMNKKLKTIIEGLQNASKMHLRQSKELAYASR